MDNVTRSPSNDLESDQRLTERQLARERDRLKLLLEINNAVVSHLGLTDLLHSISESLKRVVPHDMSGVALYDSDAGELRAHVLEYVKPLPNFAPGTPIPMEGTTAGLAFTTGHPVFVDKPDPERFSAQYTREALVTGASDQAAAFRSLRTYGSWAPWASPRCKKAPSPRRTKKCCARSQIRLRSQLRIL